jgi:type II secretion system protein N
MSSILENRLTTTVLYSTYVLLLAFFLGYYLFPYDKLALYLLRPHAAGAPLEMQISEIKPGFPPVTLTTSHIALSGSGQYREKSFAHLTHLAVKPSFISMVMGNTALSVQADAYGGRLLGRFRRTVSPDSLLTMEMSLAAVDLSLWKEVHQLWGGAFSGHLDAQISFSGNPAQWSNSSTGTAIVKVTEGMVEGLNGFFIPINRLENCALDVAVKVSDSLLKVERCRITSAQGSADVTGTVNLTPELGKSGLNLALKASLDSQTRKTCGIPFSQLEVRLKGTLENPRVEFPGPISFPK